MAQLWQALSIKQPWAAMIVHGVKTIEVRSWLTGKRGPILIHASKSPEQDPDAWSHISTPSMMETAGLVGGIIGTVTLKECITYPNAASYAADAKKHCTRPDRFRGPVMYGFRLVKPRLVEFVPAIGNTNFFGVDAEIKFRKLAKPRQSRPKLPQYVVRLPEHGPR